MQTLAEEFDKKISPRLKNDSLRLEDLESLRKFVKKVEDVLAGDAEDSENIKKLNASLVAINEFWLRVQKTAEWKRLSLQISRDSHNGNCNMAIATERIVQGNQTIATAKQELEVSTEMMSSLASKLMDYSDATKQAKKLADNVLNRMSNDEWFLRTSLYVFWLTLAWIFAKKFGRPLHLVVSLLVKILMLGFSFTKFSLKLVVQMFGLLSKKMKPREMIIPGNAITSCSMSAIGSTSKYPVHPAYVFSKYEVCEI